MKTLRSLSILVLLCSAAYFLSRSLGKYLDKAKASSMEEKPKHFFLFPTLSLCGDIDVDLAVKLKENLSVEEGWITFARQTFSRENDVP